MRLPGGFWQIVLGNNDMSGTASGARERFERIGPSGFRAQIDAAQEFSHFLASLQLTGLPALFAALLLNCQPIGQTRLRNLRNTLIHVARHSFLNLDKFIGIVNGTDRALQRVAGHAVPQRALLFLRTGNAFDPFRVGELHGEVGRLAEFQIRLRALLRADINYRRSQSGARTRRGGTLQIIAHGPDTDRILARLQFRGGKAIVALRIADYGNSDCRIRFLCRDQHAFHRTFFGGGNLPRQCCRGLSSTTGLSGCRLR